MIERIVRLHFDGGLNLMVSDVSIPRVYTFPNCHKCDLLKSWLIEKEIEFTSQAFDTVAQTEFIMKNMFGNPPVLEVGDRYASAEDMFPNEIMDEVKVLEVLGIGKA